MAELAYALEIDEDATTPAALDLRAPYVLSIADTAECTCPEYCDRDHANE
jgi:hypothetical protein